MKHVSLAVVLFVGLVLGVAGATGETRTLEHALGVTEVPAHPERVAVLDWHMLVDTVVALGVAPVAVGGVPSWLSGHEALEGVLELAPNFEFDLEALVAARPDLIVAAEWQIDEIGDALQQIAPTVFIPNGIGWEETTRQLGRVLGREEVAEQAVAAVYAKAERLEPQLQGKTVALFRPRVDEFIAYNQNSMAGRLLARAGVTVPDPPPGEIFGDNIAHRCSLERLGQLQGAAIILIGYNIEEDEFEQLYRGNPLWTTLPAVQVGRVFASPDGVVWTNFGPIGASVLLDELATALTEE